MIVGITRIRNEESIIKNTLDHVSPYVDSIYVMDDASTDNTVEICETHPKVKKILRNYNWADTPYGRNKAEGILRQKLYRTAFIDGAEWVYCFDADEYVEWFNIDYSKDCYYFRLFDFYITPEDINKNYLEREWMGPEYRDILMLFKIQPGINFTQRVPKGKFKSTALGGYVKHYGKAITVNQWEETCDYYINYRWKSVNSELQKRWKERKGKAIHTKSDFGRELIKWEDRFNANKVIKL